MAQKYILVVTKIVPKNNNNFKVINVKNIDTLNYTSSYGGNILAVNVDSFLPTGVQWDFDSNSCTINGDVHLTGNIYLYSDRTLKHNIKPIENVNEFIDNLLPVLFNWINNEKHDYGLIAQDLLKIIPLAVILLKKTGLLQVNYVKLVPFLLQSIKELNVLVKKLKLKILEITK